VALIDVGGGTTDVTVFHAGAVKHTAVLPLGGNHITNDVAAGLFTPSAAAGETQAAYGRTSGWAGGGGEENPGNLPPPPSFSQNRT
ncbi:hypothetical protein BVY02_00825, partial [bacterium J17]